MDSVKPGRYRHFKGNEYEVLYTARHSEDEGEMVVYRALYGEGGLWVRPAAMWNETVDRGSGPQPRFQYLGPMPAAAPGPCDILGVGFAVYDWLVFYDGFPAQDSKLPAQATLAQGGGPCATALAAAAKLGAATAFVGNVGDDAAGNFMLRDFARWGVSTAHVTVQPGRQSPNSTVIINSRTGGRTCMWSYGTVAPTVPGDIPQDVLKNAKILHLDAHMMETAIWAAKKARQHGVLVSLDAGTPYPGIERLLPLVDILIPCERFALAFTGCATAAQAMEVLQARYSPRVLAITQGEKGGLLYQNGAAQRYPAFAVDTRDSNGAGDVFHGAFLAATLRGMPPPDAARFASAAAAIKCGQPGSRQGAPTWAQAEGFLAASHTTTTAP